MSAFTLWETFTGCLSLTGNAYLEIQRNNQGDPIALWPLHPSQTEPVRLPSGEIAYRTLEGQDKPGEARILKAKNVMHVPLFCFDGLRGLSPVAQTRNALGLAAATEKFGSRFFGNGARPGGVLSTVAPLDEKQQSLVRETWQAAQGGHNQGRTAVLFGDWKYESIGLAPEDSQFLETRQFQRAEIAAIFRVPPHMVGDTTRLSNSNHEQQSLQFVTDTLRPYLSRIENEVIRKLFPADSTGKMGYEVAFDVQERLRGDFETTMQGYSVGLQNGFLSPNDVRKELGQNPIGPEGDIYRCQVNMMPLSALVNYKPKQEGNDNGQKA
jgi:HK97 family phage portal protein